MLQSLLHAMFVCNYVRSHFFWIFLTVDLVRLIAITLSGVVVCKNMMSTRFSWVCFVPCLFSILSMNPFYCAPRFEWPSVQLCSILAKNTGICVLQCWCTLGGAQFHCSIFLVTYDVFVSSLLVHIFTLKEKFVEGSHWIFHSKPSL